MAPSDDIREVVVFVARAREALGATPAGLGRIVAVLSLGLTVLELVEELSVDALAGAETVVGLVRVEARADFTAAVAVVALVKDGLTTAPDGVGLGTVALAEGTGGLVDTRAGLDEAKSAFGLSIIVSLVDRLFTRKY